MKLLFVAPTLPYPPLTGSTLITLNHIKHLSARHKIDLISFTDRKNPSNLGDLPRWCNNIKLIDRPPRWRVLLRMLSHIIRDPHVEISRAWSLKMSEAVEQSMVNEIYDVVLFQMLQAAQFLPHEHQGPTIWSLEDPLALKIQRMLLMYPWYWRPLQRSRSDRLKYYDLMRAPRFSCVTFVNKEDALEYKRIVPEACADWVPHGVDDELYCPSEEIARRDGMIVITGNMFHVPNIDAVEFFCKEVFPLVCERRPSANLWLVGARPAERVRRWAKNPRIKVTGGVSDIRPYLHRAMVSACPIRLRIGTQTKILEALACATPVVTTSAGNYGIGARSGEHLQVADDPVDFANRIVELLNGDSWHELSQGGRRFVRDNFSWSASALKLEQILDQLAATSTGHRGPSENDRSQTSYGSQAQ
jgi:polysaccharide biosynthesis protein PslH